MCRRMWVRTWIKSRSDDYVHETENNSDRFVLKWQRSGEERIDARRRLETGNMAAARHRKIKKKEEKKTELHERKKE